MPEHGCVCWISVGCAENVEKPWAAVWIAGTVLFTALAGVLFAEVRYEDGLNAGFDAASEGLRKALEERKWPSIRRTASGVSHAGADPLPQLPQAPLRQQPLRRLPLRK